MPILPDRSITYLITPILTSDELNVLFTTAWPDYAARDFAPVLERSLAYVGAYSGALLVGFVNLAWDGGVHAFLLDTTVHGDYQRRGIGRELVAYAINEARRNGIEWVHVDYEPHLHGFYTQCGFSGTYAGLVRLQSIQKPSPISEGSG